MSILLCLSLKWTCLSLSPYVIQFGVLQFGVLQFDVLQFSVLQLGVLQLGVLQLGVLQFAVSGTGQEMSLVSSGLLL